MRKKNIVIIIHRRNRKELNHVFSDLCQMLDIPYKWDKDRYLISLEHGLLHAVYIQGRTGAYENLAGLRPDFYNGVDERVNCFLEQGTCKTNGIKLDYVCSVLKIIDILKISEVEK